MLRKSWLTTCGVLMLVAFSVPNASAASAKAKPKTLTEALHRLPKTLELPPKAAVAEWSVELEDGSKLVVTVGKEGSAPIQTMDLPGGNAPCSGTTRPQATISYKDSFGQESARLYVSSRFDWESCVVNKITNYQDPTTVQPSSFGGISYANPTGGTSYRSNAEVDQFGYADFNGSAGGFTWKNYRLQINFNEYYTGGYQVVTYGGNS